MYGNTPLSEMQATGKRLFQQNCQSCHALDKALTGPALRGFTARGPWGEKQNIYDWIHNPAAFMTTDAYTKALKDQYSVVMQAFPDLTNDEIDAITDYITVEPAYSLPVP